MNTEMQAWTQTVLKRLVWCTREVGLPRTASGLVRLASLAVSRPSRAEVVTRASGFRIAFNYPTQLMPLLVVFEDLLDAELAILPRLLGQGRIAVDVGASIGTWTLCAARTGATVHACEPDSGNISVLKENVFFNGFASKVTVHELALGVGEGWGSISLQGRRYLTNVRSTDSPPGRNAMRICSLDDFARRTDMQRIDVLKVNTAGCEADVLEGSRQLFKLEKIGVALVLDGLAIRPLLDVLGKCSYELGFYDSKNQKFVAAQSTSDLDDLRPGPMNRYVLVKHRSVTI